MTQVLDILFGMVGLNCKVDVYIRCHLKTYAL